jgi:hypothetical protein
MEIYSAKPSALSAAWRNVAGNRRITGAVVADFGFGDAQIVLFTFAGGTYEVGTGEAMRGYEQHYCGNDLAMATQVWLDEVSSLGYCEDTQVRLDKLVAQVQRAAQPPAVERLITTLETALGPVVDRVLMATELLVPEGTSLKPAPTNALQYLAWAFTVPLVNHWAASAAAPTLDQLAEHCDVLYSPSDLAQAYLAWLAAQPTAPTTPKEATDARN